MGSTTNMGCMVVLKMGGPQDIAMLKHLKNMSYHKGDSYPSQRSRNGESKGIRSTKAKDETCQFLMFLGGSRSVYLSNYIPVKFHSVQSDPILCQWLVIYGIYAYISTTYIYIILLYIIIYTYYYIYIDIQYHISLFRLLC